MVAVVSPGNRKGSRQAAYRLSKDQTAAISGIDKALAGERSLVVIRDLLSDLTLQPPPSVIRQLGHRFLVHINLFASGTERVGFICLLDEEPRPPLDALQMASLGHIADIMVADRKREQRHLHLMHAANRAMRVDRMLRIVSESTSCADALTHILNELCTFHGAASGRVWMLGRPDDPLTELCQYRNAESNQGDGSHCGPLSGLTDAALEALRRNRAVAMKPAPALSSGPHENQCAQEVRGFVCVPIWVQQHRFGIGIVYTSEDADLESVLADISSLADVIRPALSRKVTEERIQFAAHHDDLTKLENRLMFQERLHQAFSSARSEGPEFALFYLDLDGFKLINDTLGHEMGDKLLVSVAGRLRESARETDTVARMGGDEFAIIQQLAGDRSAATAFAERLLDALGQPFDLNGRPALVGASIGIAFYPQHAGTPELLLRFADIALYQAKKAGRNTFRVYSSDLHSAKNEHLPAESDLRKAIEGQVLTLAFQPVCESRTLGIVGFEALVRWTNASIGPIEPGRFVPLAESSGLIGELGQWAIEAACTEAAAWGPSIKVSVNVSPSQLRQRDLTQQIADVLSRTGLPGTRLELEVTEGLLLDDAKLVLETMESLKALGIRIVLDDFGTAYATLDSLRRFPFDGIKIDKCFVDDLCDDRGTQAIVEAILALGESLNIAVVAEGVETERQLKALRDLGCPFVQGYLSGKPCGAAYARRLLVAQ